MRVHMYMYGYELCPFSLSYIFFFQQNSFNMLLQKMFAARVYVYVCKLSCVICVCMRVCVYVYVCVAYSCARVRAFHTR